MRGLFREVLLERAQAQLEAINALRTTDIYGKPPYNQLVQALCATQNQLLRLARETR